MSTSEAVKFLAKRKADRALKLVPRDDNSDEPAPDALDDVPPDAGEGDAGSEGEDKPPETEPTWAQRLRADLGKKTARVAELEKRHTDQEARFEQAHRTVQWKIEDVQADIEAERGYSKMLEAAIDKLGYDVPADWKRALHAERERDGLKRQLARGQSEQAKQGHAKSADAARAQLGELGKKIPEIGAGFAGKDPQAKAWLQERFALDDNGKPIGLGMKNIERDAIAFAKALRWDRHSSAQGGKRTSQPPPGAGQRPASTTLRGGGPGAGGKRTATIPKNEAESTAWLAARRAARK